MAAPAPQLKGSGEEDRARAQKILPIWVKACPRAAAKAYQAKVNAIIGTKRSACSLLFDVTPMELPMLITPPFGGFTIKQLSLPKGTVTVVSVRRPGVKRLMDPGASLKVQPGDELIMRGVPHALACVGEPKGGRIELVKSKVALAIRAKLNAERESLRLAAEELQARLRPHALRRMAADREARARDEAAVRLQSTARGQQTRRRMAPERARKRRRTVVGQLMARRGVASLFRGRLASSVASTSFVKKKRPAGDADAPKRRSLVHAVQYSRQTRMALSHAEALNKLCRAAPEARSLELPRSVLSLLLLGPVELSAKVQSAHVTVEELQLPPGVDVACMRMGSTAKKVVPKNKAQLDGTKLLKGDEVTLRGLPHRLAAVASVGKGGGLVVVPPKARHEQRLGEELETEREELLQLLEKLALWVQLQVRRRLALRAAHRRGAAALTIQIAAGLWLLRQAERSCAESRALVPVGHLSFMRRSLCTEPEAAAAAAAAARGAGSAAAAKRPMRWSARAAESEFPTGGRRKSAWDVLRQRQASVQAVAVFGNVLENARVRQKKKPSRAGWQPGTYPGKQASPQKPLRSTSPSVAEPRGTDDFLARLAEIEASSA